MDEKDNLSNSFYAKKERSAAYPSLTLPDSVELGKKLYSALGSSNYSPRETIAKILTKSIGSIQMDLSSLSQYGLLEMKSKVGYKPSELLKKIIRPLPNEDTNIYYLEALKSPKLYVNLIMDLQGEIVPSAIGLANILCRKYGITEKASKSAAEVFIQNLQDLKLLDSDNHLATIFLPEMESETTPIEETNIRVEPLPSYNSPKSPNAPTPIGVTHAPILMNITEIGVPLKSGKTVKLIISNDLGNDDIERVKKFILSTLDGMKDLE